MSQTQLPPIQPYHPTTFLERGVAVPFTTPVLGGTRARPAEKQGLELVIPNPSGGRGVYIMPWTGIASLCRPTLHDKVLSTRIAVLRGVTPATIRRVARAIAGEGLAGEDAMEAARLAADTDQNDRLVTNFLLLMALIEQARLVPASAVPGTAPDMPDQESRARLTIAWAAPLVGHSTEWTAAALEALADIMAPVGVGPSTATGRIPRLIALLGQVRADIAEWSRAQTEEDHAAHARMICAVADLTLSLSGAILAQAHALTGDMLALLRAWAADPDAIVRLVGRPEWLLDGWEHICLIWNHAADDAARRAALAEIVEHVPVLPREVNEWCQMMPKAENAARFRRLVYLNEDWRTGATVFDLIARNEQFRAAAC